MPHVELPQAEFKVVLLGDSTSGKTSLVLRFAEGYYRDTPRPSTVGAFFITKRIQTSQKITCKIQIWDTAGQAQFRPMAPMYYKNASAAIVCYDVNSEKSYSVMREWLDELHRNVPAGSIVIAMAPTKCDLLASSSVKPAIPIQEAKALAQALGAIFVETSAKDNYGVTDLFQKVAERVLYFREKGVMDSSEMMTSVVNNEKDGSTEKERDSTLASTLSPQKPTHHSTSLEMLSPKNNGNTLQDADTNTSKSTQNTAAHNVESSSSSSPLLSYMTHPPLSPLKEPPITKDVPTAAANKKNSSSNPSNKSTQLPISSSAAATAKMLICDSSPLACGMFGNVEDPSEDNTAQSCLIS